jgi:hypothetical protein
MPLQGKHELHKVQEIQAFSGPFGGVHLASHTVEVTGSNPVPPIS